MKKFESVVLWLRLACKRGIVQGWQVNVLWRVWQTTEVRYPRKCRQCPSVEGACVSNWSRSCFVYFPRWSCWMRQNMLSSNFTITVTNNVWTVTFRHQLFHKENCVDIEENSCNCFYVFNLWHVFDTWVNSTKLSYFSCVSFKNDNSSSVTKQVKKSARSALCIEYFNEFRLLLWCESMRYPLCTHLRCLQIFSFTK